MKHVIGQHLLIGISGLTLTNEEKKFIVDNNISGVTLFARNISEPKQVRALCAELQSLRKQTKEKTPLYIGIDMEGGRVARFKPPFTQWPALKKLGDLDSPTASFHFSFYMGKELRAVGINLDYAPCIDVFSNPDNKVIGDRAISSNPEMVAKHSSGIIRGYIKAEVIPCPKHFPGHGNTLLDSHEDLPVEQKSFEEISNLELIPFKKAFRSRIEMLMTAHIRFPKIDPEWPAPLSEIFLKKILREELRYRGLLITDDLGMKALAKHYDPAFIPVRALQAGADLLLYCNEPETPPIAIAAIEKALTDGKLKAADLENSYKRILAMKKENILHPEPLTESEMLNIVGHADHYKLSQSIGEGVVPTGLVSMA